MASCELALVEVMRAVARAGPEKVHQAQQVFEGLVLVRLEKSLLEEAAALPPQELRSLDAIHLAAALSLGKDVDQVVTYDRRMITAALSAGVEVVAPGAEHLLG